ncbi:molybdopterin-binding protein, partial [Escherichia coli]|nr:molybdopterin-binding protein [Escherichia coli]
MRCDVLAVGTELLLGQIVDTNSGWIGQQLAVNGIDSLLQVKVGDNRTRMAATLRRMLAEADAV